MTGLPSGGAEGAARPSLVGQGGKVVLRDLRALAHLGAGEVERRARQPVRLTLAFGVDVMAAGRSDRLEEAVDYGAVAEVVVALLASGEWRLLEGLARSVAEAVLAGFGRVTWVEIEVAKVRPPVPLDLAEAAVALRVDRGEACSGPEPEAGGGVRR